MAWAETAEKLKDELTDKYVVVMDGVPELRRFVGRTGMVKTVNMSGRALVQFDAPADISWYDIDPSYLTVVDAPLPKRAAAKQTDPKSAGQKPPSKPAAKAGLSPLEMARQQGAAGGAPAKAAPAAGEGKKLSPLEMARQQGAAGSAPAKPAPAADAGKKLSPLEMARQQGAAGSGGPAASKPAAPAAKPDGGQKLSPLELARQQGAAKQGGAAAPPAQDVAPTTEAAPAEVAAPQQGAETPAAEPKPTAPPADTSGMSKIELARMQGPFKG
jgi:hypothetical protein